MNTQYKQNEKGFTIIEVVLVLAIAALIFLMVFIALPALQRNQRDTQRRNDLGRISTQVTNFSSSARGAVPATSAALGNFTRQYLGGASNTVAGDDYQDPTTGEGYTITWATADPGTLTQGTVYYRLGRICATDGTGTTTSGAGRNYALLVQLEGQTAPYCVDNHS